MTLCVAWIRKPGINPELVMATDSRLSGGETWDGCPKLIALPRTDCMICYAGSTIRTYPLILQLQTSIASFPSNRNRVLDFDDMQGHTLRVFNEQLNRVAHEVDGAKETFYEELANSSFLLCGYSASAKTFRILRLAFSLKLGRYVAHSYRMKQRLCVFIGDVDEDSDIDLPNDAKNRLNALLYERKKLPGGDLDWEPFEILKEFISDNKVRSVGGPPQVAKIYQNMRSQPFAVYWPSKENGRLTILGRPALDYELTDWPRLDAATLSVTSISLGD